MIFFFFITISVWGNQSSSPAADPLPLYGRSAVENVAFEFFCSSQVWESRFSLFFSLPYVGTAIFFRFLFFPSLGKPIFHIFPSSQPWESIFRWFLVFPVREIRFSPIFDFPHEGKLIFTVFRSSATAETQNLSVFDFPPRRKWYFFIFCFSAMAEMKFLLFFTRPPRRKANFQRFLAFSRGWRMIFGENW